MMRIKPTVLILVALCLFFCISACGTGGSSSTSGTGNRSVKVSVGTCSDPTCLVPIAAVKKGFFARHGVDASLRLFANSGDSMNALVSGGVDIAGTQVAIHMFQARAKGAQIQAFANVGETHHQVGVVVDGSIRTAQDLVGKKIGTTFGTAPQLFDGLYLQRHGLSEGQVTFKNIAPPEMVPAMARGDIDGFFGIQPYLLKAQELVPGSHMLAFGADHNVYKIMLDMTAMKPWLDANQDVAVRVVEGLDDAVRWLNRNPAGAVDLAMNVLHMDKKTAKLIVGVQVFAMRPPQYVETKWRKYGEFLSHAKLESMPSINDPDSLLRGMFDPKPYRSAMSGPKGG